MKQLTCPLNGLRNISEFVRLGPYQPRPEDEAADEDWVAFVFMDTNRAGHVLEWWMHTPSAYCFVVERNTLTAEILNTWKPEDVPSSYSVGGLS